MTKYKTKLNNLLLSRFPDEDERASALHKIQLYQQLVAKRNLFAFFLNTDQSMVSVIQETVDGKEFSYSRALLEDTNEELKYRHSLLTDWLGPEIANMLPDPEIILDDDDEWLEGSLEYEVKKVLKDEANQSKKIIPW